MRALTALLTLSTTAAAQDIPEPEKAPEAIPVAREDLKKFLQLARERKCLDETPPVFKIDPVVVITDKDGRVFYTGADPDKPYTLTMDWCHYHVKGEGQISLVAAMMEPETWGFRFRPKAFLSYLPTQLIGNSAVDGVDTGVMLDFFYYEWLNLNAGVGIRGAGAGLGLDITQNFGGYVGYVLTWQQPMHNLSLGGSFAF